VKCGPPWFCEGRLTHHTAGARSQFSVLFPNPSLFTLPKTCSEFFAVQPSSTSATDLLGVLSSYLFHQNSLELRIRLTAPTKEAAQFKLWDGQRNCHNFRRTRALRRQRLNLAILGSILSPQIRLLSRCRGKGKTPHLRIVQFDQ